MFNFIDARGKFLSSGFAQARLSLKRNSNPQTQLKSKVRFGFARSMDGWVDDDIDQLGLIRGRHPLVDRLDFKGLGFSCHVLVFDVAQRCTPIRINPYGSDNGVPGKG